MANKNSNYNTSIIPKCLEIKWPEIQKKGANPIRETNTIENEMAQQSMQEKASKD